MPKVHSWLNRQLQAIAPPSASLRLLNMLSCILRTLMDLVQVHLPTRPCSPTRGHTNRRLQPAQSSQDRPLLLGPVSFCKCGWGRSWQGKPPDNPRCLWEGACPQGQHPSLAPPLQCWLAFPRGPHISAWYATGVTFPGHSSQLQQMLSCCYSHPPPLAGAVFVFPNGKVSFTFLF